MDELSYTEDEIRAAAIAAFPVPAVVTNTVYVDGPLVAAMLIDALKSRASAADWDAPTAGMTEAEPCCFPGCHPEWPIHPIPCPGCGGQESPAEVCPCAPGNCSGRYSDAICRVMRAEPDQCDKSWLRGVFAMAANRVSLTELANGEIPERVTRVEVIDETGRAYSRRNVYVRAMCQDDGRTLKLFIDGDKQGLEP
jgi:hypothetical protein